VTADSTSDVRLLFAARSVRLFGYGMLSVVLVLYLAAAGIDGGRIGVLLTCALLGDTLISLWIATAADRIGRKRMLLLGAGLVAAAGTALAASDAFALLLVAATIGIVSPGGNEVGPFLALEQAALSQVVRDERRTNVFAWYALAGSLASALGALFGGGLAQALQAAGWTAHASYRAVIVAYALGGTLLAGIFAFVSPRIEAPPAVPGDTRPSRFGIHRSRPVVARLVMLFGLDAFAGGLILQSLLAYWLHLRFGLEAASLGVIFFWAQVAAAFSALAAARIAARIGLVRTMVYTHLPSNVMLMLVPLMPSAETAVGLLLLRYTISQMDVPTRQSYTMAVVVPEERAAAAGVTGVARTVGASLSPMLATSWMAASATMNLPLLAAGALKIVYDLLLFRSFAKLRPPEEVR
jgi:MFS family permease